MTSLEFESVSKSFGPHKVIDNVSVSITDSDRVLLLGKNGSGKSTFLKLALGLLGADSGSVTWNGSREFPLRETVYFGDRLGLYSQLSVLENLEFFASLYKSSVSISSMVEGFSLEEYKDKKVHELSKGLAYRSGLARAFLCDASCIVLDEPSSFLDEQGFACLSLQLERIQTARGGKVLQVIATHDLTRFSALANRLILIADGKIAQDTAKGETLEQVLSSYKEQNR